MTTRVEVDAPAFDLPIVVWAPNFDEKSGGCIVLHLLAHLLREMGHEVYLSRYLPPVPETHEGNFLQRLRQRLRAANRRRRHDRRRRKSGEPVHPDEVTTHPTMPVPTMPELRGRKFVAIYPEIVDGNPLKADHVVRWLLYRPGFHAPGTRFTENELVFFYQRGFLPEGMDLPDDRLLALHWIRDDVYQDLGLPDRHGTCRMVRKGKATFDPEMAKGDRFGLLDHLPHEEIARIFNQCDVFVSHDPYTMYLYYAARCGCVPVVVPQPGLDAATWRAGYEMRFGVAYGEEELDWARSTRTELMAEMVELQEQERAAVRSFAGKLRTAFGSATA